MRNGTEGVPYRLLADFCRERPPCRSAPWSRQQDSRRATLLNLPRLTSLGFVLVLKSETRKVIPVHTTKPNSQSRTLPTLIAWFSLGLLAAAWTPFLPISRDTMWGYIGLAGLTAALGLNSRTIDFLKRQAVIDNLTGLASRSFIHSMLRHEIAQAGRHGERLSLIFVDIDQFKHVNDTYGHASGDEVLKEVARTLRALFRDSDTVARYGGDEFVVLLPRTDRSRAGMLAERARVAVESRVFSLPGVTDPLPTTISLGIATFPEDGPLAESLLQHADESLYAAKNAGRNTVAVFGPQVCHIRVQRDETEAKQCFAKAN